jgi:hypothetical protein
MKAKITRIAVLLSVLLVFGVASGQFDDLFRAALKAGGAVLVADKFGKDIDKGINSLTQFKATDVVKTKIVPILSIGQGGYVGIAQVMGPVAQVDKVQAVGQVEGDFARRALRLKALVPISTKTPGKSLDRVDGVGVSAIADIKL